MTKEQLEARAREVLRATVEKQTIAVDSFYDDGSNISLTSLIAVEAMLALAADQSRAEPVGETIAFVQEWLMSGDHEPDQWHRDFAAAIDARTIQANEALVRHMTDRFLGWPVPADFAPDGGISAKRPSYAPEVEWRPVGTNLLTATQAEAMVRYLLEEALVQPRHPGAASDGALPDAGVGE